VAEKVGSTKVYQPDFSGGPTEASPIDLTQLDGVREYEILEVTGGVQATHDPSPSGTWFPLKEAVRTAPPGMVFPTLYLHSNGDTGASVTILARDYCEDRKAQTAVEILGRRSPRRLEDALASGTTIADGAATVEEIDLENVQRARIRAQVSGISSWQAVDAAGRTGAVALTSYATPAGEPRVATVDGTGQTIRIYDAADPEALVQLTSFTGTAGTSWERVLVDEADELALVLANDSAGTQGLFVVLDISTDPPSSLGSVAHHTVGELQLDAAQYGSSFALDPATDFACHLSGADNELYLLDYADPANPALADNAALAPGAFTGMDFYPDGDALWAVGAESGSDRAYRFSYQGGSLVSKLVTAAPDPWDFSSSTVAIDRDRGELVAMDNSGGYFLAGISSGNLELIQSRDLNTTAIQRFDGGGAYDPANRILYLSHLDSGTSGYHLSVYDVGADQLVVANVDMDNTGGLVPVDYDAAVGQVMTVEETPGAIGTLRFSLGADALRVFFLDPEGNRVSTENPAEAVLESDREEALTFDVVGEHAAEIEVAARSGAQATVDYVDVYPLEL
jgi:WD40 repeat protein